jgi:hypothetical protein
MENIASSAYGLTEAQNASMNQEQTKVGWWKWLTGGKTDTEAAVSQANYDRMYQTEQARIAREFNSAEAQKNRDYQTMMSNSAYQRSVADMKAAGLNPALMYSHGAAESSPGGSSATASAPGGRTVSNPAASTGQLALIVASVVGPAVSAGIKAASAAKATNAVYKGLYGKGWRAAIK